MLQDRLESDPASLSPNVALRPLVQDTVLPILAAVLGPAEWAYHRQLRESFELMAVPFPSAVPRLRLRQAGEKDGNPWTGERESSPLARPGNALADPHWLVAAAKTHLEHWEAGRHGLLVYQG